MDFEKICMLFTMQEPFYGILLSSMKRESCTKKGCDTIQVTKTGNVFKIEYNPNFINGLPVETVLCLLKHEILHVVFSHFSIFNDCPPTCPSMYRIQNIACDLEVNSYIDRSKIDKKAGGVFAEDFGWDKCLGTREYFRRLMKMAKDSSSNEQRKPKQGNGEQQSEQQQSDCGSGEPTENQMDAVGANLTPFDSHEEWPTQDEEDAEDLQQMIDDMLDFAATEVEKSQGSIPGEIAGRIAQIRKRPKPVADWKRYFRRYMGNEFSEFIRKSKKRESRRFPDAEGNRHRRKSNILVAIDTSGSVSMPEYHEFFGQIRTLTAHADFHVLECDAGIAYEYDYKNHAPETLHGGGGTSFRPAINYFLEHRKKYDALVYFTDGGAAIPENTPKETLWVISSKGNHDHSRYRVNGASVVIIPKKH